MADYLALKTELAKGDLAALSDSDAADMLNVPGAPTPRPVPMLSMLQWAGAVGLRAKIEDASRYAGEDATLVAIKSMALAWIDMVWGVGVNRVFDVTDPQLLSLLDVWVQAGLMSSDQRTQLVYLAATPGPSRAESILGWGLPVTVADVAHARSL